jgi:uncharacterized lipoprotein YmbA
MRRFAAFAVFCAFVVTVAGCASPRSNFYTLTPSAKPAAAAASYSVAVGPVSVPSEVDRPQIVVRLAANQVAIDEFHRWASPLPDAISRVIAENLAATLGTPHVTVFTQPTAAGARYRVLVDVLRLESAPGESATLDAVWTVRSTKDGTTRSGRTKASEPVPDREYTTLAAAHSRALGRLSADLAGAIQALERGQ